MALLRVEIDLFIFGSQEYKIIGMISHLGPQLGVADGIALSHVLRKQSKLTAVFFQAKVGLVRVTFMKL